MNSIFKKLILGLLLISFFSCSEELNFEQADDLEISPIYTSSLVYFTVLPNNFFDDTGVLTNNSITDSTVFRAFENSFFRNNIFLLDLNVECKNEFSRAISIDLEFLDANNNQTYPTIELDIAAGDLDFEHLETILIANNPAFVNTLQVRITTEIEATGAPINSSDTTEFELKSAVTAYINSDI